MLLGDEEYLAILHDSYHAALKHLKKGPWYVDVHVATGQVTTLAHAAAAHLAIAPPLHKRECGAEDSSARTDTRPPPHLRWHLPSEMASPI